MDKYLPVTGRVLLALIFVMGGLGKLGAGYAATQGYMDAMGVPGMLLPLVILLEIGGGIALIVGWKTRYASILLAGFTVVAALIFHNDFANQMQMIMFMKNLAISGGLLLLAANGSGAYSLDERNK
ncbi:MAG: DoxX family protein [Gammaproteobacteria bacterium]|nr:DoxX family protein [Gammaproteobacteria bacterium]